MKLMVAALLLVAASHAEVARSKQKEDSRTERRAEDGVVQKRAPAILPTVSPATPGVEYADSKDSQTEKTPIRQIYAQPASPVAKISDVLTGQGPPFPAAIASHLFSPIPIYQPRLSSPTTYEISAPIPSQLAYSEHKITYQPQQNAIQYAQQEYNQKLPNPKQAIARLTLNYQPYPQQLLVPQPVVYQQSQPVQPFPVYQQAFNQPIQYQQAPAPQYQPQGFQQPLIQLAQAQPGIAYADEGNEEQTHQRPAQRELKTGQPEAVKAAEERAKPQPQPLQNYNAQPQGAVSYASFSVGAPAANYVQPQQQQYQPQQQQLQQQQQQHQQLQQQHYQIQQQHQQLQQQQEYQQQQQSQQQQFQLQPIQVQPIQYQPQPQYQVQQLVPAQRQISKPEQNLIPTPAKQRQIFIRQGPVVVPFQPQVYQGQAPAYQAAAPHFPPIQYFGKFAHSIFGQYQ